MDISAAHDFWLFALEGEGKRERTLETYSLGVTQLADWLKAHGHSLDLEEIDKNHVRGFLNHKLATTSASTTANRHKALKQFFSWLESEGEIDRTPLETIKAPKVVPKAPPMIWPNEFRAMVNTCEESFMGRRDRAILHALWDCGLRLSEITGLQVDDVNLSERIIWVEEGKGGKSREVPFTSESAPVLSRYLMRRERHHLSELGDLWLGKRGPLSRRGITQMVTRRADKANIGHVNVHRFRHGFADRFLSAGGQEGDLMRLGGWADGSRSMLDRYGRAGAERRAVESYRRLMG